MPQSAKHRKQIREKPLVLGATVGTLELGRSGRRLVHFFRNSEHLSGQDEITQIIHLGDEGLEFRREWDKAAVSMVVMTPITMSLIFVAVWSAYFIHQGDERQAVVTSAFTVATYVVTVGKHSAQVKAEWTWQSADTFNRRVGHCYIRLSGQQRDAKGHIRARE